MKGMSADEMASSLPVLLAASGLVRWRGSVIGVFPE
jgi:hypothetical protein